MAGQKQGVMAKMTASARVTNKIYGHLSLLSVKHNAPNQALEAYLSGSNGSGI